MTLRHRYSLSVRGSLKVGVIIVVLSVILGLPIVVLSPLGAPTAGSLIGLGGLAIAFVARATNPRVSIYAALGLGLGSLLVVNAAATLFGPGDRRTELGRATIGTGVRRLPSWP